ncbi:DUF4406 domain-containing protein [Ottowia sp. GY511]|uniref:DUF4406 domain-containing protein n=1 Tax=Ottowia flava TaxID=2675430 RepID=A0ABW4KLP3_9BURK|nr:DUF4406 domain-containing protein [Ottowia sp. GY511]TXK24847.1 DUF4406 domain-containing protein [Ottowia sp. GY511]
MSNQTNPPEGCSPFDLEVAQRGDRAARNGPRIYLSGPMTGLPDLNFPAFHAMSARLRAAGHSVVNPAELNSDPAADWNQCMRRDIAALCTCTTLALMPGWETSQGAQLELHIAHRIGLGIVMAEALVDGEGVAVAAARADEREQCARICDAREAEADESYDSVAESVTAGGLAEAIRARANKKEPG